MTTVDLTPVELDAVETALAGYDPDPLQWDPDQLDALASAEDKIAAARKHSITLREARRIAWCDCLRGTAHDRPGHRHVHLEGPDA